MTHNITNSSDGVSLHCGWGRLLFAHTFSNPVNVAKSILNEAKGERDIAFYLNDPHIALNTAPQSLFLDPSHTYRLEFSNYVPLESEFPGIELAPIQSREELTEINRIYSTLNMVTIKEDYVWHNRNSDKFHYVVAKNRETKAVIGVVMGVDHMTNFNDMLNGSSLWSLGVDPQAEVPKIGESLVRYLIEYYKTKGRSMMDLSVIHDNKQAIRLYDKLNFEKVAVFAIKRMNSINEKLFVESPAHRGFNPYAEIIIQEALRRGIDVQPEDPTLGYFRLSLGGRSILCRESLTDQTSAIALSRCDDKRLTREILEKNNLSVPKQIICSDNETNQNFLEECKAVVVKPLRGEQGKGISVDVRTPEELNTAIDEAKVECETVILEQFAEGKDLRIIVINNEVVAAAIRKPPRIIGTGKDTIETLIEKLSRRRQSATAGESQIPVDKETLRTIEKNGYSMETVLDEGVPLYVRKTANLHTGGTIHDVTKDLHPKLADAAVRAARALEIPVTGLDFIVPHYDGSEYVIIEANERPGLANHEPQPTAEKFIDFLFPQTITHNIESDPK